MMSEAAAAERGWELSRPALPEAVGAWILGFAPAVYLGLDGGGYDVVVRSQIGIAAWWILAIGVVAGIVPALARSRDAWIVGGVLGAFSVWSCVSATWAPDAERALSEGTRNVALLGIFLLIANSVERRHVRVALGGLLSAFGTVVGVAALSRLHPAWFAQVPAGLPAERLSYPLNYWNATGTFAGMGAVLSLGFVAAAKSPWSRALAAAPFPCFVLVGSFTLSRGSILATFVGCIVLLALSRDPLRMAAAAFAPAVGAALVVAAAAQRPLVRAGAGGSLAGREADELLVILFVLTASVAAVSAGARLIDETTTFALSLRSGARRVARGKVVRRAASALALAIFGALVLSVDWSQRWQTFSDPTLATNDASRLSNGGGNGRWQLWEQAWALFQSSPLRGSGAGSFASWWPLHATIPGQVRNAHNYYIETLGELGIVGGVLLLLLLIAIAAVARRAVRAAPPTDAPLVAGTVGSVAVFLTSCIYDWTWQVTVLPAATLVAIACLCALAPTSPRGAGTSRRSRGLTVALTIAALVSLAIPLAGTAAQRRSQTAAARGDLTLALRRAGDAAAIQPYASAPLLQRALILERRGDLDAAAAAARAAAQKASLDWRTYLILARIEAERGNVGEALAAYRRSKALNKQSVVLK